MQRIFGGRFSRPARQAITDLYDEKRGAFLVQYPIWLVLLLGLAGVAAFAITGFLGYPPTARPSTGSSPILTSWSAGFICSCSSWSIRSSATPRSPGGVW